MISFEEFKKVQLKVGQVKSAEKVHGSDQLIKLSVDCGEGSPRTLAAGIAKHYSPEKLVGRKIVVVTNLQPKKLRGIESNGMLLAAYVADESKLFVLDPGQDMPIGADVS